jgi:hypothetical protein
MPRRTIGWALAALALAAPAAAAAATLELRDVAARVTVIPEDREDIDVQVTRTNPRLPVRISREAGGTTVVEGGLAHDWWRLLMTGQVMGCSDDEDLPRMKMKLSGVHEDLPEIVVRTPRAAHIESHGSIIGSIGRSDDVDLSIAGCDHWTIANVRDDLAIRYAGAGRVNAGSARRINVKIFGAGDVAVNAASEGMAVELAGAGDVTAASASGPVKLEIAGNGDVKIGGGHASQLTVHIAGSGDVDYLGVADSLDASIAGAGDINVAKVDGPVSKSVAGSGSITVGP